MQAEDQDTSWLTLSMKYMRSLPSESLWVDGPTFLLVKAAHCRRCHCCLKTASHTFQRGSALNGKTSGLHNHSHNGDEEVGKEKMRRTVT